MTTDIANQFLKDKTVFLTDLNTSIKLHRPLVTRLLDVVRAITGKKTDDIPFT